MDEEKYEILLDVANSLKEAEEIIDNHNDTLMRFVDNMDGMQAELQEISRSLSALNKRVDKLVRRIAALE
jgi:archaellum component FlaC